MLSKSSKNIILRQLLGQSTSTSIASTCYLGLLKGEPVESGTTVTVVEPDAQVMGVDSGYERTLLGSYSQSATYKMTIADGEAINTDVIYLCECLEHDDVPGYPEHPWGECTYFGLFTAKTGGNCVAWGQLKDKNGDPAPINPTKNQIPVIRKEQLEITIEE